MTDDKSQQKSDIRTRMRSLLAEMDDEFRHDASAAACANLTGLDVFRHASVVMLYMPLNHEVDLTPAAICCFRAGKTVCVPSVDWKRKDLNPVEVTSFDDEIMEVDEHGLRTPHRGRPVLPSLIDLVVVPGLAFDPRGNRLGRGVGFYDRFLGHLRRSATNVGLTFDVQIIDDVPADERDMSVDIVVTDRRVTYASGAGRGADKMVADLFGVRRHVAKEGTMVLPSQTARPARKRTHMKSPPARRRRGPVVIGVLLVLVVVLFAVRMLLPDETRGPQEPATAVGEGPGPVQAAVDTRKPETPALPQTLAAVAEHRETPGDGESVPGPEAAPTPQPPLAAPSPPANRAARRALEQMETGLALAEANRPVEARQTLTAAVESGALEPADASFARDVLGSLNHRLVFSPQIATGDPFVRAYVVATGDRLTGIVRQQSLQVDWRFLLRVNRMASERSLRVGQRLKLVTGPFHAVVDKSDFRLDLYLGTGAQRVFVAGYPVGLGEFDSTPVGRFQIRPSSKLIDPSWANPRTGERFGRDDPANPIGEHWIGLQGMDEGNRDMAGYGIHGTIEPETIGRQASMGCIRMLPDDVALVYEVLTEQASTVEIRP